MPQLITTQDAFEGFFRWLYEEYMYPRKVLKRDPDTALFSRKTRWYHTSPSDCSMLGRSLCNLVEVFVGQGKWERKASVRYRYLGDESIT